MVKSIKSFIHLFLVSFSVLNYSCSQNRDTIDSKPNVIFIITDDQGYGDMSCHGNPWLKTPNIDKLYKESTRLTDFHVSPTCAPTRAALLTGHYSNRTGVWHTVGGRSLLRKEQMTMADVFAANGYSTGIFGKWHLGDNYPFRPQDRGFQEVLVHGGGGIGQGPDHWNNDYFDDTYLHNGNPEKFEGYCTDVWFENAKKFIDNNVNEGAPFFCYLATNAPHDPYHISNDYVEPYKNNDSIVAPAFNGMIKNIDENLGKLMEYLEKNNLRENTILVFMTDNGTSGGGTFEGTDGQLVNGFNSNMRGKKASMYEGGHRVPFFISWPKGNILTEHDVNDLTAHIDILPTFVDLLDFQIPTDVSFDGQSIKEVLVSSSNKIPARSLITDSQRIEKPEKWRRSSVMNGFWRLINGTELYNIQEDSQQENDLANQYPEKVQELREDYNIWWDDISPVFDESPAIELCVDQEPITLLRSHDMHMDNDTNIVPWNQRQIRVGKQSTGWYEVKTNQSGTYKFTLLRWPPEVGKNLLDSVSGIPALDGTTVGAMVPGESLNILEAGIFVGNVLESTTGFDETVEGVSFQIQLEVGNHELRAWFINDLQEKFAPYYIKVERI